MRLSKKNVEVLTKEQMYEQAVHLHASLVSFGVHAHAVPQEILRLRHLYREVIKDDQQHYKPKSLSNSNKNVEASSTMWELLNKFAHFHLSPEDEEKLQPLEFPEAEHLRAYLLFEKQVVAYAKHIHQFMIGLKKEMSAIPHGNVLPFFYRDGAPANGVKKAQKILVGVESEHVPLNLIQMFNKVFDTFADIKPSRRRPPNVTAYYTDTLNKMNKIGFIAPEPQKKKKRKIVRKRKSKSAAPAVTTTMRPAP